MEELDAHMSLKNFIPAMKFGNKVGLDEIAGLVGLPYVGNVIYVDPTGGNDSDTSGAAQNKAYATVAGAYADGGSANHDVVLIAPSGGTGRTTETTAISWAKRFLHLVGSAAPNVQDARAGISFGTGGSINFTENGGLFKTLTFNGTTDINVPVSASGDYNAFVGVDFKGSLNDTTGDDAAARALVLTGAQENTFSGCTFGADTFVRSTTNATVEFASSASRNVFADCRFLMAADNVGPNHILLTGGSAIDRWLEFNNCLWYSFWANDADKVTHVIDAAAQTATGHILMTGQNVMVGFDDWEAADSGKVYFQGYTNTANVVGIGINPNVS